ncbi:hypothetical protein HKX54_00250 [Sulfitobacter sp. M57]|uniref:hypothetical protein n=1 Tax=unclassified Sulfitobacter TaxID=196795 RepID=UPI0023E17A53|nr:MULTISPECIES: hypothetical protein [unclassified Sulfitobacter]MDF3412873.1 hypothetical protein [Sulfitobacter sp. KE5]MDF3421843.1 hypothetical protein [Sulfitobacter sp. KE43]MDF3431422.1 hypothetical protein [Sulfitobacter sp. KE42]MDF3457063.1 hypothetical protein [Sulfitobacter sp. S74]MDF3460966.1 hypothetical protein [Sulfitobacter sp. Ks18]
MLFLPFLIIVVIAVAIYANRNKDRRRCRWRQNRHESDGALIRYNCITCGQEAFRSTGAPRECLAQLGRAKL